ncbi:exosome complex RNA-binding protein Csl4 [Candidatus Bathyarchaeota archaeon]|nr:exosome complex RNA-binding protein Csl4 [Candidatus Bathyarchaeota archaeon]
MSRSISHERFVVPGSRLGVIEEFTGGEGTLEMGGVIYSRFAGIAKTDPARRTVTVKPRNTPNLPSEGRTVVGVVTNTQERMAVLDLIKIENEPLSTPFTAILHISAASPRYERSMTDVCRPLDLVRAKVASTADGIVRLTTVGKNLGVLKAYCSNCGYQLILRRRLLKCERCNNTERRKLAADYISGKGYT